MTAKEMYDYLVKAGMTPAGACGALANIRAESGLIANNLQNDYEKKLGYRVWIVPVDTPGAEEEHAPFRQRRREEYR